METPRLLGAHLWKRRAKKKSLTRKTQLPLTGRNKKFPTLFSTVSLASLIQLRSLFYTARIFHKKIRPFFAIPRTLWVRGETEFVPVVVRFSPCRRISARG